MTTKCSEYAKHCTILGFTGNAFGRGLLGGLRATLGGLGAARRGKLSRLAQQLWLTTRTIEDEKEKNDDNANEDKGQARENEESCVNGIHFWGKEGESVVIRGK